MPDLTRLVDQFASRYRGAVLATAGVWAGLSLAIASVLAWRLQGLQTAWRFGAPSLTALIGLAAAGWWLRKRWMSGGDAARQLDQALGLDQRLVTAEEFAKVSPAPSLYPLLVEDTEQRYATEGLRLPRPLNRPAGGLAALLLALLLWPMAGNAVRLAQLPKPPPQIPPDQPPPEPTPQDQQNSSSSDASSGDGQQQGGQSKQPQQSQQQQQSSGNANQPKPSKDSSAQGQQKQPSDRGKEQKQGQGQQQGQQGRSDSKSQDAARGQEQQQGQGPQPKSGNAKGQTGVQSPGNEALRAEIQELLKEVSGELQQLQAQLAQAQDTTPPPAGTGTDPNLYGNADPLPKETGGHNVPIQLKTDKTPSTKPRKGGGTGRPSGEVSGEGPKAQAEAADLSDQPSEESAASRQPIPPAYRSIFDRLQQSDQEPPKPQ